MGFIFAYYTVENTGFRSDVWKNRPDLKPYPAMVKQDKDDVSYKTAMSNLYKKHRDNDRT